MFIMSSSCEIITIDPFQSTTKRPRRQKKPKIIDIEDIGQFYCDWRYRHQRATYRRKDYGAYLFYEPTLEEYRESLREAAAHLPD